MTFEWVGWLRSIVGLFFVVGIVEALLPPKNAAVKQILSLIILIGIFAPFFNGAELDLRSDALFPSGQQAAEQQEDQLSDQILRQARREIENRIFLLYREETGQELYAMEVKLEMNQANQLAVTEVSLVIKEEIGSYNKDKVCRLILEQFGAKDVSIKVMK